MISMTPPAGRAASVVDGVAVTLEFAVCAGVPSAVTVTCCDDSTGAAAGVDDDAAGAALDAAVADGGSGGAMFCDRSSTRPRIVPSAAVVPAEGLRVAGVPGGS